MSFYMIERACIKEAKVERGNYVSCVDDIRTPVYFAPEYSEETNAAQLRNALCRRMG